MKVYVLQDATKIASKYVKLVVFRHLMQCKDNEKKFNVIPMIFRRIVYDVHNF